MLKFANKVLSRVVRSLSFLSWLRKTRNINLAQQNDVEMESILASAREYFSREEFTSAIASYKLAIEINPDILESYISTAICYLKLKTPKYAIELLLKETNRFESHEAIFSTLAKCYVELSDWASVELYWHKWKDLTAEQLSFDFYLTSGEILAKIIKFDQSNNCFIDSLLEHLIFQHDSSVVPNSNPVLCNLLFHHHEYDRITYKKILNITNTIYFRHKDEVDRVSKCTATLILTFGLVDYKERDRLINRYFLDFDLYSHWSFILIGTAFNEIWDDSIKSTVTSLHIIKKQLRLHLSQSHSWSYETVYKLIILASICDTNILSNLIHIATNILGNNSECSHPYYKDIEFITNSHIKLNHQASFVPKKKLNIAVCVSGQLRGWKSALKSWEKLGGLSKHNLTYIVHVWKETGSSSPIPPKDERTLPVEFRQVYREIWNKLGHDNMKSHYPNFYSLWDTQESSPTANELAEVYKTKHIYIEDDLMPPFNSMSNAEKMYYKISQCQKVCDQIETEFDLVIRIRPDLEFVKNCAIDWHELYKTSINEQVLFCESYSRYMFPNIGYSIPDQFSIASQKVMRAYSNAYDMTVNSQKCQFSGFPSKFLAHTNVAYSTLYNGIHIKEIKLPCKFSPAINPNIGEIKKAIELDSINRQNAYDNAFLSNL